MSIGTKSLFSWEMGQSPRADLILTQIVVANTAAVREGFFPTMLSNDAFCLFKSEGEEDNRSGGPQDSFAGSAEDVVDEEPENDIEGVTYTASGDSYDSMEASTGDPNVEFAEGY